MSNKNEYNYYKNEYGKYKANYYSPGSEEYKKRQSDSRKQKAARILRAAVVFIVIVAIVVGIVFGIVKLTSVINENISNRPTTAPTTEVTTVAEEKEDEGSEFKAGTKCIVKTEEGTGINLRSKPTYDVAGYQLVVDGETIVIAEISEDGKWCKTSNFENNGWLNLKYLQIVGEEEITTSKSEEVTTEKVTEKPTEAETTTKIPETTTEGKTQIDSSITSYSDAIIAFRDKGGNTAMNCTITGSGSVFAVALPSASAVKILVLFPGESVRVVAVDGDYSKIVKSGYESAVTWVPNANLSFVSWAN